MGTAPAIAVGNASQQSEFLLACLRDLHLKLDPTSVLQALADRCCALDEVAAAIVFRRGDDRHLCEAMASAESLRALLTSRVEELLPKDLTLAEDASTAIEIRSAAPFDQRAVLVPWQTSQTRMLLLLLAAEGQELSHQARTTAGLIAHHASVALENAESYQRANFERQEMQQLLEISSELGGTQKLDAFLQQFVVRAAEFLGFGRAFIALAEGDHCHIRWGCDNGVGTPLRVELRSGVTQRVLRTRQPFWSDDVMAERDVDRETAGQFNVKQYLVVPLFGSDGHVLGLMAVLDRLDGNKISAEDVRRAQALASEAVGALEATQNLHLSEQHRRRAEILTGLALELGSSLRLPEFVQSFLEKASELLGARAAILALARGRMLEVVSTYLKSGSLDRNLVRRINEVLTELEKHVPRQIQTGTVEQVMGVNIAELAPWKDITLIRLTGGDGELLGVLCLADRDKELTAEDRNLLQAVASHVSVSLQNSRLFSQITQSNRHWAEIFDAISDFIVVHDAGKRVLRVNRSLAEFIGVQPSELIGLSMRALVSMTSEPGLDACPFCRPGMETMDEYIHPVLERTYLVSSSRIHGALDEGLQTIHVLKDITDRREAERRYRELFENIHEGVFFSTPAGRFIEVNDALVRMLGYSSREELLQIHIPTQLYVSPEHRQRFQKTIEEQGVLRNYEEALRRKDGSTIHTIQNTFAVRDSYNNILQYRGVILDITELKTFQGQLQRERDFNTKVLNNTQSLILVVDTAGLISYANRRCSHALGYDESQILGKPLHTLISITRKQHFAEAFDRTLEGEQVDNLEIPLVRGDSKISQFSVNLSPMRDEQGAVNSIVAVMTDVTDAAIIQAKLTQTEKMAAVGQLVSGVAHEVNNPLTAILGFADLLAEQPDIPAEARKDLQIIIQEAQRTRAIVQNLLSFARRTPQERKLMDVNDVIRRTLQLRAYDFNNRGVQVREEFDDSLPQIIGDAHQLQQVFLNIVNNAYDAVMDTGRPAQIRVTTQMVGNDVEIAFTDNGPGIKAPERIFDPFFTTKEVGKGTGLGLSICYGIVREHGGEILCGNNEGEHGATFRIRLPLAVEAALAAAVGGDS